MDAKEYQNWAVTLDRVEERGNTYNAPYTHGIISNHKM